MESKMSKQDIIEDVMSGKEIRRFKLNEKVIISETKSFTVVGVSFSVCPSTGTQAMYLELKVINGSASRTHIIHSDFLALYFQDIEEKTT